MFDTIILLTGPAEHAAFATMLRGHHPSLTVVPVFTVADLAAIDTGWLRRARLVSVATDVIVPDAVTDHLGYGAYHFHPGPPSYPDRAAAQLALREQAPEFGCTLHRVSQGGRGPIIDVDLFAIPPGIDAAGLEQMAYTRLVHMFWRMSQPLATQAMPLIVRALRWGAGRPTRSSIQTIGAAPLTVLRNGVKLIESSGGDFSIAPSIPMHGSAARDLISEREVSPHASVEA